MEGSCDQIGLYPNGPLLRVFHLFCDPRDVAVVLEFVTKQLGMLAC